MKIQHKEPESVIRLTVSSPSIHKSSTITFTDTTVTEVIEYAKDVAAKTTKTTNGCALDRPSKLRVEVFKAVSQKRSGSKSFTIYDIFPSVFKEQLIKHMK